MRRVFLCLAAALALAASAAEHQPKTLSTLLTPEFIEANFPAPLQLPSVPKYGDPFWTDSLPQAMRHSYIKEVGRYKGDIRWESIDPVLFAQFRKTGNRTNYENASFAKRRQLAIVAMAELVEGQGRLMPDLIKGLHSMCEETWWGIPAHYPHEYPTADVQPLALFSAEAGAMVAWIYYLFEEPIKEFSPILYERLGQELKRRVLDPGLNVKEWWYGTGMNWNPWICSNWLATVLLAEPDPERRAKAIGMIAESVDAFMDAYPEDGGCDEGPMYFDRAAGSMLDVLALLKSASAGAVDLSADQKLHNMAQYIGKMMIDDKLFVNFADAAPGVNVNPESFAGADAIADEGMMALVANQAAAVYDYYNKPSASYNMSNFPSMGREMMLLPLLGQMQAANQGKALVFDAWMPTIQVLTARSVPNSTDGLYFAAKGGHNNESHNHNDVGSFIVYADGLPMLVDPGIATYTASSFTNDRYKQWNVQSLYHNLPVINGLGQMQGRNFAASDVKADVGKKRVKLSMDIAGAYPKEAHAKSWIRAFDFTRGKSLKVTESYALNQCDKPVQIVLMAAEKPEIQGNKITFFGGKHGVEFNPSALEAAVEEMPITDERMSHSWTTLYRITLTARTPAKVGKIEYTVY